MYSTATRMFTVSSGLLVALLAQATPIATSPTILREPVFGLRYETHTVKFDPLPLAVLTRCSTLLDDQNSRATWFIFGQASDASSKTYYVIGGYETRLDAPQSHQRYQTEGLGVAFSVDDEACTIIDSARQVFDDRLFDDELPQTMLQRLASDAVLRLVRAFGSVDRVRAEFQRQRIDTDSLPPELAGAMKPILRRPERH